MKKSILKLSLALMLAALPVAARREEVGEGRESDAAAVLGASEQGAERPRSVLGELPFRDSAPFCISSPPPRVTDPLGEHGGDE